MQISIPGICSKDASLARERLFGPWKQLGLQRSPFDNIVIFQSGTKMNHFQKITTDLHDFANSVDKIAVVSGPAGIGKTALLEGFCSETGLECCRLDNAAAVDMEIIIKSISSELALEMPEKGIAINARISLLLDEASRIKAPLLVVIDDCQRLSVSVLFDMVDFIVQQGEGCNIKFILLGHTIVFENLMKLLIHNGVSLKPKHLIVPVVAEHELKAYLHRCLVQGGWSGALPEISSEILDKVYSMSKGIPAAINSAAEQFLPNYLLKRDNPASSITISLDIFRNVNMAILLACCTICYGSYSWFSLLHSYNSVNFAANSTNTNIIVAREVPKQPQVTSVPHLALQKYIAAVAAVKVASYNKPILKHNIHLNLAHSNKVARPASIHESKSSAAILVADAIKLRHYSGYSVQLLASSDINEVLKIRQKNLLLSKDMYIYQDVRANMPWYVLLYGNFYSKDLARSTGEFISSKYHFPNAWVKSLTAVKAKLMV